MLSQVPGLPLTKYGVAMPTVFHLLGETEVDATAALGFALAHAPTFAAGLLAKAGIASSPTEIRLEEIAKGLGRTDVEVIAGTSILILEAKVRFAAPSEDQIDRYAAILEGKRVKGEATSTAIVVTSAWPDDLAFRYAGRVARGSRVCHISWQSLIELAALSRSKETRAGKLVLNDLRAYLRSVIAMTDVDSNLVYVVSLGDGGPPTGGVTWRNVVTDHRMYWHPVGGGRGGWPVTPPNYLGFRWHGRLQQVAHVEGRRLFRDPREILPGATSEEWGPHVCYSLGPPILPQGEAKSTGIVRASRLWGALDLLLLCDTIVEARELTKKRRTAGGRETTTL